MMRCESKKKEYINYDWNIRFIRCCMLKVIEILIHMVKSWVMNQVQLFSYCTTHHM